MSRKFRTRQLRSISHLRTQHLNKKNQRKKSKWQHQLNRLKFLHLSRASLCKYQCKHPCKHQLQFLFKLRHQFKHLFNSQFNNQYSNQSSNLFKRKLLQLLPPPKKKCQQWVSLNPNPWPQLKFLNQCPWASRTLATTCPQSIRNVELDFKSELSTKRWSKEVRLIHMPMLPCPTRNH